MRKVDIKHRFKKDVKFTGTTKGIKNEIEVLDGNTFISCYEDENPNKGLHYNDFSVQSLLDSGATDLLKNHSMLSSNDIDAIDKITELDSQGVYDIPEESVEVENKNTEVE